MTAPEDTREVAVADSEQVVAAAPANPARKIILISLCVLLLLYIYHVAADRITPYTSQATVDTLLVQIAPEVTGQVIEVGVKDNGPVKKGQVMFRVDPEPFQIALRKAEADLAVALQGAEVSAVEIGVAKAALQKQRVDLAASRQLGKIVIDLVDQRALAETQAIRARADISKTQADVQKAEAELERARQNLGAAGYDNPNVKQAVAAIQQARLNLTNSTVIAPADGVVTNLRLSAGQYVNQGQPLLSFIEYGPRWISAAMRENQLGNLEPGDKVVVALDDNPGKLFQGRVDSIGWGIAQGGEAPTGQLPDVQAANGWLREPQRFPVRIVLTPTDDGTAALAFGRSGAQANVMVFTDGGSILNPIGRLYMRIIALLSYLR
ncbi:HlyD family secretion protein [Sphingomonas sp. G124]|uniref:HlyD family secretion protein n=1 Tax=Sphingomonas cremea TaxID=2904799 RepID=A0A9X1QMG5_9SPHN|nr:HlyD family secretion protein [Sphingomonas cremea]MCF2515219.1 HlyD family secretion protein [Sphingomonas cremea]